MPIPIRQNDADSTGSGFTWLKWIQIYSISGSAGPVYLSGKIIPIRRDPDQQHWLCKKSSLSFLLVEMDKDPDGSGGSVCLSVSGKMMPMPIRPDPDPQHWFFFHSAERDGFLPVLCFRIRIRLFRKFRIRSRIRIRILCDF
jgi:hypothetical protein